MRYITLKTEDPICQHEINLIEDCYYKVPIKAETIRFPANTRFGSTKPISCLTSEDAAVVAKLLEFPDFCYPSLANLIRYRVSLYRKAGVVDPKDTLPYISILSSGAVYRLNRLNYPHIQFWYPLDDKVTIVAIEYLISRGYLLNFIMF